MNGGTSAKPDNIKPLDLVVALHGERKFFGQVEEVIDRANCFQVNRVYYQVNKKHLGDVFAFPQHKDTKNISISETTYSISPWKVHI